MPYRLDHAIHPEAAGPLKDSFHRILVARVHGDIRTKGSGDLESMVLNINHDRSAGARAVTQDIKNRQTQASRTQNRDLLTRLNPASAKNVMSDRIQFDHWRVLRGDVVRQPVKPINWNGHVLPEASRHVDPEELERYTGVDMPGQAGRTLIAGEDRVDNHPVVDD